MKSDTRLDSAVFQLTPTRTRCDLVIIANGKTEKIASGLLDPFLAHLKAARDQIAKGGYSITLEPGLRSDAMWFTKDTVERFVRFVSTPEVLERVNTIESEMLQIDEAIVIQGNDNLGLSTVEDDRVKSTETTEGNKYVYDADAEKAIVLFKPGVQPPESNGSTTLEENSKVKLLRVLETRKTVLQKEQGMAFARAVAAGFDMDHMTHLLSFAEYFGASRLMEASIKFMELWKRKHETGQWLEIEATEAMSSRSDFSSINASGIVFSGEVKKQKEFSEARYKPHNELGTEGNGKTSNDAPMGSQHLSSDNNGDKRPPLDSQVPLGAPEYFQGHFQHPMYPQWPMHSPSGAPVFQAYPMQGMPYYQASGPFFQSPYPPMEDPRFNGAHRMGQKRHSMDSKDSNVESGASNGRSQDSTDQSTSEKEVLQGHETKRKNGRSGKAKSGMVVIRNINYITSKRDDTSGSESHSASESDEDAEELQSDAPRRKHKNSLRSSKNRGSLTKSTDTWNSNDRDDVGYEQQTDDGNWQAFQNFLLRDGEESTSTVDRGMFSAETEAPIKKRQNTTGADPIIDQQDTSDASHQQFSKFDAFSGNGTRIYKQRVSNDELAISQGHSHGGRVLRDGQLDVQFSEVESGRGGYKRGTNDDFMLYGQRTQSVSNSYSDPLVGNEFGHADKLDKSSSHNVTDESFIVPFRSSPQDQVRSEGRTAIDIDSEFPSNCQIAEDSSHRLRSQLSYEPDVLSLMPVRSTERGSAGYDPAVDYEMEVRAEDAIAADNGNQEDGAAVKEGLKKLEKGKKSRLQDALEKRKMEAAMRKGKPSKMNHLTEAQVRAERLRAYKADLQKMKREKEEEEMKRLEGLKRERQRRIAARSNTVPAQSSSPSLQSKSRLPAKLSPGSNKGSKFSDAEPGSSSPLQRLPSKVTSAAFNDPQKTAQSSRFNTTRLAGNGLSRSVSSLPDLKKENDAPEPKSVPVRTRRLSDPKGSGGYHASLKSGGSGTLPKPKVPDEPEIKKISALSDPKGSGGHHASLKSGGSGTLPKPKVPDEPEIKKISAIMSLDKTKTATLPELKIRTSRSNSDVTQNKSASKEVNQRVNGNKSSLAPETIKPKKSDDKIPPYSNGDDNPVIEKTVVMLEHDILAVPALQASVERKEDTKGPYEDASKIDTVEVTEYASIHPPAPPIRICEEDKYPSKLQLDEHSNSNKVIMDTTSDELPKSSNISFSEKPYQAPYARVSSLEDPCTSNSEYNKAPLIGTEMETITETVKAHVCDFTDINSPVLISESLEKSRGRESSKGFRRLLKFGRKNHSSAMGEHSADSDKLSIESSVIDDHYAATASSNEVPTLKNLISQDESHVSTNSHKVSRHFSLLSPFRSKNNEKSSEKKPIQRDESNVIYKV